MTGLKDATLKDLITGMIASDPNKRLTVMECLGHPYFQNALHKLAFMQEFSDYIETYGNDYLGRERRVRKMIELIIYYANKKIQMVRRVSHQRKKERISRLQKEVIGVESLIRV